MHLLKQRRRHEMSDYTRHMLRVCSFEDSGLQGRINRAVRIGSRAAPLRNSRRLNGNTAALVGDVNESKLAQMREFQRTAEVCIMRLDMLFDLLELATPASLPVEGVEPHIPKCYNIRFEPPTNDAATYSPAGAIFLTKTHRL